MIQLPRLSRGTPKYKAAVEAARGLVEGRLRHFSALYGIPYRRVFIRKQRTRWGSASSAGNLNFNYRLAFLPPPLMDYIVVHELCHLAQPNHSAAFWELVLRAVPDWKERRKALRSYRF